MIENVCSNCTICEGINKQTKPRKYYLGNTDSPILFIDGKTIDNEELVESVLSKLFEQTICYTNAVRCMVNDAKDSYVFSCSLYTYFLLNKKRIIFVSKLGKEQLEIEEEFEVGKMFVHNNKMVMFVDDVIDISEKNLFDFYVPKIKRLMENN